MLLALLILAFLFIKLLSSNSGTGPPESIGEIGERLIAQELGRIYLWGYQGMLLKNIYIPKDSNGTTEIDLLYITQKGIFVIESKYYSGYIFGSETQLKWTTSLYAGKDYWGRKQTEKIKFYNPIMQNKTHIKYLSQYLGIDVPMISLIVFSERCELMDITITSPDIYVCQLDNLSYLFSTIWNEYPDLLSVEQVESIYNNLLPLTNIDEALKHQHVQNINKRLNNRKQCPFCGGSLVLRTVRNGPNAGSQFYGCSNFPRCRFTENLIESSSACEGSDQLHT